MQKGSKNNNISKFFVSRKSSIRDVLKVIDLAVGRVALVVDNQKNLEGTVTDGDIRRGLLCGKKLEDMIETVMNNDPVTLPNTITRETAIETINNNGIDQIPLVDMKTGRVTGLFEIKDYFQPKKLPYSTVIMAGGQGKRLQPLTNNIPKPMLEVAGKPMLEIILNHCIAAGLSKFYISVKYLKEKIIEYFGDGSRWNVEIQYIIEEEPLGTAGSLSLMPRESQMPVLIINGDVLSRVDLSRLFQFHKEEQSSATLCVHEHKIQIPFGVISSDKTRVRFIEEKPIITKNINAGIYVLNHEVLKLLSKGSHCDMTQLLNLALKQKLSIHAFPLYEYYRDIGQTGSYIKQAKEGW